MPNMVRVLVDGVDDLLNAGMYDAGAVVQVQSCATETGVFTDLGTVALVSGTNAYTIYDPNGSESTWYRTRYENAGGTVTSAWSDPFQVGGEQAGYLCSLYDVKQRLGIADSVTTNDEELLSLIRAVSAEIERATGCDFTGDRSDGTYTFDIPYTTNTLWVDRGIQTITTLGTATESQPDTAGTYTTATATTYGLRPLLSERDHLGEPARRVVFFDTSGAYFYAGYSTVQIVGRLGWAEVPPEVERIAAGAVVAQWMTKGSEGPRALVGPDGRTTILRDISPADWSTLMSFKTPVVG